MLPSLEPADAAIIPLPPGQPASGLGADGPCRASQVSAPNPDSPGHFVTVYSPTGTTATPMVGGRCDDPQRPVVVVVHGLLAGIDAQLLGGWSVLYSDLIDHLVSVGNVVIFATYETETTDFVGSYARQDAAIRFASGMAPRADLSSLGIVGHSMGGGAVPYLAQQAVGRGWGADHLWLVAIAPWYVHGVGTGQISVPSHARVSVIGYDNDTWVDNRMGIDLFRSLALPLGQRQHVTVRSQSRWFTTLNAQHAAANSVLAPNDAIRFFGLYQITDATGACSLLGTSCTADLSYMGRWSDGRPVTPAISTDDPVDMGPVANTLQILGAEGECTSPMNPRRDRCSA